MDICYEISNPVQPKIIHYFQQSPPIRSEGIFNSKISKMREFYKYINDKYSIEIEGLDKRNRWLKLSEMSNWSFAPLNLDKTIPCYYDNHNWRKSKSICHKKANVTKVYRFRDSKN